MARVSRIVPLLMGVVMLGSLLGCGPESAQREVDDRLVVGGRFLAGAATGDRAAVEQALEPAIVEQNRTILADFENRMDPGDGSLSVTEYVEADSYRVVWSADDSVDHEIRVSVLSGDKVYAVTDVGTHELTLVEDSGLWRVKSVGDESAIEWIHKLEK